MRYIAEILVKVTHLIYDILQVTEGAQSKQDTSQSGKSQSQPKKVERKVASVGPNRHIQGKGKNAWK